MILLDANILLEAIIPKRKSKEAVIKWFGENVEPYAVSMLSVHLVLHFGLKEKMPLNELRDFLSSYPKAALIPEDYSRALELIKDDDHEDALQLATAERLGCSHIVTLDNKFIKNYRHRISFINPVD